MWKFTEPNLGFVGWLKGPVGEKEKLKKKIIKDFILLWCRENEKWKSLSSNDEDNIIGMNKKKK